MSGAPVQASAPGKAILFGEHAVVYGHPAIAVPVSQVAARATIRPAPASSGLTVVAPDVGQRLTLSAARASNPLAVAARLTLRHLSVAEPDATLVIESSIPIASGLGSGAAVSTALVRALAEFLDRSLSRAEVSELVFEVEKIHHGTPSGIDNTVVAYGQPIYFERTATSRPELELISVGAPFSLLVVDSGLPSPTRRIVSRVRAGWRRDPEHHEALFHRIGAIARDARERIETGNRDALGSLMDRNHTLLVELGVSSPALNRLVEVARAAGARGAKLSGAGEGGCVLALIDAERAGYATEMLDRAGAVRVIHTTVE